MSSTPLLNIRDYAVERFRFEANLAFQGERTTSTTLGIWFRANRHAEEARLFRIELDIALSPEQNPEPHPYWLDMKIVGFFESLKPMEDETVPALQTENALTILYGIARGVVGTTTGNSVFGKYTLPGIAFKDTAADARILDESDSSGPLSDQKKARERTRKEPTKKGAKKSASKRRG